MATAGLFLKGFIIAYLSTLAVAFGVGKLVDMGFEKDVEEK